MLVRLSEAKGSTKQYVVARHPKKSSSWRFIRAYYELCKLMVISIGPNNDHARRKRLFFPSSLSDTRMFIYEYDAGFGVGRGKADNGKTVNSSFGSFLGFAWDDEGTLPPFSYLADKILQFGSISQVSSFHSVSLEIHFPHIIADMGSVPTRYRTLVFSDHLTTVFK